MLLAPDPVEWQSQDNSILANSIQLRTSIRAVIIKSSVTDFVIKIIILIIIKELLILYLLFLYTTGMTVVLPKHPSNYFCTTIEE